MSAPLFEDPGKAVQHYAVAYLCIDPPNRADWLASNELDRRVHSVLRTISKGHALDGSGEPISDFWDEAEAHAECRSRQASSDSAARGDLFTVRPSRLRDLVAEEAAAVHQTRQQSFRRTEQRRRLRMGHQPDREIYWIPVIAFENQESAMADDIGPTYDLNDPEVWAEFGVSGDPQDFAIDDAIFLAVLDRLQQSGWDLSRLAGLLTPDVFWERYGYAFDRLVDDYELIGQRPAARG